jgi:hypothetical protein
MILFHNLWSFSLQTSLGNGSSLDAFFPVSRLCDSNATQFGHGIWLVWFVCLFGLVWFG